MAGIQTAEKLMIENRNKGTCVAIGTLLNTKTKYIIVKIDNDGGMETVYDYGSDIRINNKILLGDRVMLTMLDKYRAEWGKM